MSDSEKATKLMEELEKMAKPLSKFVKENFPYGTVIITPGSVKIVTDEMCIPYRDGGAEDERTK